MGRETEFKERSTFGGHARSGPGLGELSLGEGVGWAVVGSWLARLGCGWVPVELRLGSGWALGESRLASGWVRVFGSGWLCVLVVSRMGWGWVVGGLWLSPVGFGLRLEWVLLGSCGGQVRSWLG
jgi:hypothetical protein